MEFVKREYGQGLEQKASEMGRDSKAEEINLVRKIETRTRNLIKTLNSIESLTNGLNKNLLPPIEKKEAKAEVEARQPKGWLENHLADLDSIIWRTGQIYEEVTRLMQATKIDKVGQ